MMRKMDRKTKILVLENMSLYSAGISLFLEKEEFEVSGIPCNWQELTDYLKIDTPDVILINLVQCSASGIGQLENLKNEFPDIPVLLIAREDFADDFTRCILSGVNGIVFSSEMPSVLSEALHQVANGREFFPGKVFSVFKNSLRSARNEGGSPHLNPSQLSPREISVLSHFCEGLSYKEIGNSLGISARTVETHRQHILSKLKIRSTAEMVRYAIEHHLI
jgi:DNA-binding NarL/FixJ family response regulator